MCMGRAVFSFPYTSLCPFRSHTFWLLFCPVLLPKTIWLFSATWWPSLLLFILSFTPFLISPPILHNYSYLPIWPFSAVDCDTHPPWAPFTTSMPWFIVLVLPYRHVLVLVLPYKHVPPFYSPLYFYSSVSFWAPSSTTPHLSEWWVTPWHLSRYLSWETRKRQTVWLKFLNMNSKRGSDLQDGNTQQKW